MNTSEDPYSGRHRPASRRGAVTRQAAVGGVGLAITAVGLVTLTHHVDGLIPSDEGHLARVQLSTPAPGQEQHRTVPSPDRSQSAPDRLKPHGSSDTAAPPAAAPPADAAPPAAAPVQRANPGTATLSAVLATHGSLTAANAHTRTVSTAARQAVTRLPVVAAIAKSPTIVKTTHGTVTIRPRAASGATTPPSVGFTVTISAPARTASHVGVTQQRTAQHRAPARHSR